MKEFIKKIVPYSIRKWNRNRQSKKFKGKDINQVFTEIYDDNHWASAESVSGHGSEAVQTESLIKDLNEFFKTKNIKSVLDIPCGDFNWMQRVDLSNVKYIGADIVESLIKKNKQKFQENENLQFQVLDLTSDDLPASDVIIVRDCLVHLSYENIEAAINNMKSSNSKYLLTTTFPNANNNHDIITGDWRALNFEKAPFNFPKPILVIDEVASLHNLQGKGKAMYLWELASL